MHLNEVWSGEASSFTRPESERENVVRAELRGEGVIFIGLKKQVTKMYTALDVRKPPPLLKIMASNTFGWWGSVSRGLLRPRTQRLISTSVV